MKNKSQITIFVIIGLLIIAFILGYFLVASKPKIEISQPSIFEPEQYIAKCARDAAINATSIMMPQGGYVNPKNYKMYEDQKVAYLCYTNQYYKTCTIQQPLYIEFLENEITKEITPKIEECFLGLKSELESKNYKIEMGAMQVNTELATNVIKIKINRMLSLNNQGETQRYESFKANLNSPLYNLAIAALEVANQETKFCNFEYIGFMLFYPEFSITKKSVGSGKEASKIYIIEDRTSGKKLNIAIRSCAVPPGF